MRNLSPSSQMEEEMKLKTLYTKNLRRRRTNGGCRLSKPNAECNGAKGSEKALAVKECQQ
jgi:hypothetical protein